MPGTLPEYAAALSSPDYNVQQKIYLLFSAPFALPKTELSLQVSELLSSLPRA